MLAKMMVIRKSNTSIRHDSVPIAMLEVVHMVFVIIDMVQKKCVCGLDFSCTSISYDHVSVNDGSRAIQLTILNELSSSLIC